MKILLFDISNIGKSTIGKDLSLEMNYEFDDLDALGTPPKKHL